MSILEAKGLAKKYAGNTNFAVDHISLSINEGEIIALLGESGSGKTTLLRLIAGFERANHGQLFIHGESIIDKYIATPPEKRNIGMVFQDYALFPHMTVAKNVAYGIKGRPTQKKAVVNEMLELVGLSAFQDRYPHQLSGGQQQRIALARALATKPHVLLLDEPFSNLDEALKEQVRSDLKNILKQSGITAIFVTHDTRDALAVADRIAILKDGKLQQLGTAKELYQNPVNQYIAQYFGKVNWLPTEVTATSIHCAIDNLPLPSNSPTTGDYLLGIRPENIKLTTTEAYGVQAQIRGIKYFGNYQEVELAIGNTILKANLDVHQVFELGSTVSISPSLEGLIFLHGQKM